MIKIHVAVEPFAFKDVSLPNKIHAMSYLQGIDHQLDRCSLYLQLVQTCQCIQTLLQFLVKVPTAILVNQEAMLFQAEGNSSHT